MNCSPVVAGVDSSLRALRTDHIDLLLMHRPDLLMEPEALADTFRHLLAAGKVLHVGVSNHTPGQLALLRKRHPLVTNEVEFSALQMRALADGTLEQCVDLGLRPMVWSPLAEQQGTTLATLANTGVLRHPSRPLPVTGTGRIDGLREAVAALSIRLSSQDWYRVWQASIGHQLA